jgi:hypothetical protein
MVNRQASTRLAMTVVTLVPPGQAKKLALQVANGVIAHIEEAIPLAEEEGRRAEQLVEKFAIVRSETEAQWEDVIQKLGPLREELSVSAKVNMEAVLWANRVKERQKIADDLEWRIAVEQRTRIRAGTERSQNEKRGRINREQRAAVEEKQTRTTERRDGLDRRKGAVQSLRATVEKEEEELRNLEESVLKSESDMRTAGAAVDVKIAEVKSISAQIHARENP